MPSYFLYPEKPNIHKTFEEIVLIHNLYYVLKTTTKQAKDCQNQPTKKTPKKQNPTQSHVFTV